MVRKIWSTAASFFLVLSLLVGCYDSTPKQDSGRMSEEEALESAKTHINDSSVPWRTEFLKEYEVDINNIKRKADVWKVEAVFPGGNKEAYFYDSKTKELLFMSESEAPGWEEKVGASSSPSSEPGSAAGVIKQEALIPFQQESFPGGFSFKLEKRPGDNTWVKQTLIPQKPELPNVHLIRRIFSDGNVQHYQMQALSLYPGSKAFKAFPLADVTVSDSYTVDSIAGSYGFINEKHLVLVLPKNKEGSNQLQYDAVQLDIQTGEIKTLATGSIADISPDFLAVGWLNKNSGKLFLNSFSGGALWVSDLAAGKVSKLDGSFKSSWPMVSLHPSPDGTRMVFEREAIMFFDNSGTHLAALPRGEGFHSSPVIQWDPNSKYGIHEYTFDQQEANVISSEDGNIDIAPQGIGLYDRDGRVVWKREVDSGTKSHLEWAGWLSDRGFGIIREYDLERSASGAPQKINESYKLVTAISDETTGLKKAEKIADMKNPEAVYGKDTGRLIFVDRKLALYWTAGSEYQQGDDHALLLSRPGNKRLVWAIANLDRANAEISVIKPGSRQQYSTRIPYNGSKLYLSPQEDMVSDEMLNYYLIR